MRVQDIIETKRDGGQLSSEQIKGFIAGFTDGSIPDYQASALLMAIMWRGMAPDELLAWTQAMMRSGIVLDLSDVPGIKVDKHSTGGVGDKISLCLAPAVAACGVPVPMISGRGLGHTGGTLDKLESIPGFNVRLSTDEFRRVVAKHGLALIGQTDDLAPADRRMYALRDVTGTVPSIPLIASSILSKKLAEGIDALVLDVKVGSGAFMKTEEDARRLARTMVRIGTDDGKRMTAFLTRMSDPLGDAVGNANEMIEAIEVLKGRGPADVTELTYVLGAEMLILGGQATSEEGARADLRAAIDSGRALEVLRALVEAQSGDPKAIDDYRRFPQAAGRVDVLPARAGFVTAVNASEVGIAGMLLGAGRQTASDVIDAGVGITVRAHLGDAVAADQPVATLHYNDDRNLAAAQKRLAAAYTLGDDAPQVPPLVSGRIGSDDV